jgi:hypothetical protein
MKRALWIVAIAALAITMSHPTSSSAQQKSISSSIGVQVFPSAGQNASQQSKDEAECYKWAVSNTGSDPFQLQQQQQANAQASAANSQTTAGSGVRGAARGAAAGALIGGIAGDAGTGAAVGAATGAVVHRSRARRQQAANEQAIASNQQATEGQMANFRKAFDACLEAKKYIVKY